MATKPRRTAGKAGCRRAAPPPVHEEREAGAEEVHELLAAPPRPEERLGIAQFGTLLGGASVPNRKRLYAPIKPRQPLSVVPRRPGGAAKAASPPSATTLRPCPRSTRTPGPRPTCYGSSASPGRHHRLLAPPPRADCARTSRGCSRYTGRPAPSATARSPSSPSPAFGRRKAQQRGSYFREDQQAVAHNGLLKAIGSHTAQAIHLRR